MSQEIQTIQGHTKHKDVNHVLHSLTTAISHILKENLVGVYLTGSLSYGDFIPERSDIDLLVILKRPPSTESLGTLERMHRDTERVHPKWSKRIECSYVPLNMLFNILPPSEPRPYFGEGIFYPEAPYGNEWIINQYLLYHHGISLLGPNFKELVNEVSIENVREACIRDLFEEWSPKKSDLAWLSNSHYQSYVVLNLCRILYTVVCHSTATKKASALWVKRKFAPQWIPLIETAENWSYGKEMDLPEETIEFIQFVVDKVREL